MTAPPETTPVAPRPIIVRALGAIGGVLVFLLALVISLGAALGTPLGIYLVRRWARRRDRVASSVATLFGSVAVSATVGLAIWGVIFALLPRPTQKDLDRAATEARSRPQPKLPAWYTKAFPQAQQRDSTTEQLMRSPGFMRGVIAITVVMMGVFLGALGGSLGWCAALLMRIATAPG